MFVLDRIAEDLAGVVAGLEPARLTGSDAARLTATAARIEKLAATAKAALATRAEETHAWRSGRAVSPEQWLAETSGCSEGAAREALVTAKRVETLPATRERLLDGTLSMAQAALVSAGAAVDPSSERRLLKTRQPLPPPPPPRPRRRLRHHRPRRRHLGPARPDISRGPSPTPPGGGLTRR